MNYIVLGTRLGRGGQTDIVLDYLVGTTAEMCNWCSNSHHWRV